MANNLIQKIQAYNQFRQMVNCNPEQEMRKLVASGKMNQSQLNQLQKNAYEFQEQMNTFMQTVKQMQSR